MSKLPFPWKRSRDDSRIDSTNVDGSSARVAVHYPSSEPFPVMMDRETFPKLPYASRNKEVKTSVHWGQRKLLLSEIQLLSMYAEKGVKYHIVYAGSAPGTHIAFLDDLFGSVHTWELVDPGKFDRPVLEHRNNFLLRNEFFTNQTAYGIFCNRLIKRTPALQTVYRYLTLDSVTHEQAKVHQELQAIVGTLDVARGTEDIPSMYEDPVLLPHGLKALLHVAAEASPLLFLSDIRTGCVRLPNFEDHVAENMKAQQCWTEILQADFAMLKFRLPYTFKSIGPGGVGGSTPGSHHIDANGCCEYLNGDMVIPIWTRPTSTEGRLVVRRGAFRRPYKVQDVEDQFFFLNSQLREVVHFNHLLGADLTLDHHFDAAAEIHCLEMYCRQVMSAADVADLNTLRRELRRVSNLISTHLKLSFQAAIDRRDFFVIQQAAAGHVEDERGDGDELEVSATTATAAGGVAWDQEARMLAKAAFKERSRQIWWKNVDEASWPGQPSQLWVCRTMPQI